LPLVVLTRCQPRQSMTAAAAGSVQVEAFMGQALFVGGICRMTVTSWGARLSS
jgi:hypothetical protein